MQEVCGAVDLSVNVGRVTLRTVSGACTLGRMAANATLIQLGRYNRTVERFEVSIDVDDEDACIDLLRRTAKRHGLKPGDCELKLHDGRKKPTYRI